MAIQDIGSNLRRLMKKEGFTIKQLSAEIGMGTATLSNILNGRSIPRSSTLLKLADALGARFIDLLADPLELKTIRFRTNRLSGREKAQRDQTRIEAAVWLENYLYLEGLLDDHLESRLDDIGTRDPGQASSAVRRLLDLPEHAPICNLASVIEDLGIKLRLFDFGFRKTFGLSIGAQDGGPAIIVNSRQGISVERQLFTIAHELGHIILHRGSYGEPVQGEDKTEEDEANEFAQTLLVPSKTFIREWNASTGLDFVDSVLRTKKIFKVSYKTVLYRLSQINPALDRAVLNRDFAVQYKRTYNHDLKDFYEPDAISRFELIEDRYARLVRKAYDKELISISRAGELLHLSVEEMRARINDWQQELAELHE